ncbi:uncharacterized protein N7483_001411 [Penicillium malachiteum]|uniref:uncharacterized protein n=1 Tax=Penicillium malachiteum TaxID=1324776 RepID=UPI002546E652|nr:uncharacterized protein N7483_001411 [Penicillium malachiteum]KAJ5736286.1 hypothetical protein N7483_001411 [Penicillium malachiteum]
MPGSDCLKYTKKRLTWPDEEIQAKYKKKYVWGEMILQLIYAELDLRKQVQLEEKLQHKVKALEKSMFVTKLQISDASQDLEKLHNQITSAEHTVYEKEGHLPILLKKNYDLLRKDPHWFMRKELVDNCASQGGCCSRDCRCCAKRESSPRHKGKGHCTVECWCCSISRGFEFSDEQKEARTLEWKSMLTKSGSPYASTLAKSLICPVSKFRWRSFFTSSSDNASQDIENLLEGY